MGLLTPSSASTRLAALDAGRALATFGVMWTHVVEVQIPSPALAAIGRFGTSYYVAASVFLATRTALRRPDAPLTDTARVRVRRLLLPFALWSAVYALFYTASTLLNHQPITRELLTWWGPFAGTARHLWFLPFAFATGLFAAWISPTLSTLPSRQLALGIVVVGGVTYWLGHDVIFFAMDRIWMIDQHLHRLDRWPEEIPLALVTIGITHLYHRYELRGGPAARPSTFRPSPSGEADEEAAPSSRLTSLREIANRPAGLAPAFLIGFVLAEVIYYVGYDGLTDMSHSEARYMANLAGLCLLAALLVARPRVWMERVGTLGTVTYFAFLVHVLLIDAFGYLVVGLPGYMTPGFAFVCTVVVFIAATTLGAVVRRTPGLRILIP